MKHTAHNDTDRTIRLSSYHSHPFSGQMEIPAPRATAARIARRRSGVLRGREVETLPRLKRHLKSLSLTLALLILTPALPVWAQSGSSSVGDVWGPRYGVQSQTPSHGQGKRHTLDQIRRWNRIAIDASGLDHTPPVPPENRVFAQQLGPGRASRAIAIVHIAIFEALNAITGDYKSYTGLNRATPDTSKKAAIAQAAHDTLVALFSVQKTIFDEALAEDLSQIPSNHQKAKGIALGQQAASSILALRAADGSNHAEPRIGVDYDTGFDPGLWRQDPISQTPLAVGAHWGGVKPFVLRSGDQFRVPAPPSMDSPEYAVAYDEAKRLGGDGIITPTERTPEQTEIGIYWAYDGVPSLCAPPRLYNQIAVQIADQMGTNDVELARLLVLVNTAMADAGIAIWESKFYHNFWRPVTAIREADEGTGPTGAGDGNPATIGDLNFTPLGAPATNLTGPNFTPPFPTYPSGHAGFGGAVFQILRRFYGTDHIPFTFVSDEYNGVTQDNTGAVRPLIPRSFSTFSQAEEENGQSRIYLGIHWSFDKTEGITLGRHVGDYVFENAFAPQRRRR